MVLLQEPEFWSLISHNNCSSTLPHSTTSKVPISTIVGSESSLETEKRRKEHHIRVKNESLSINIRSNGAHRKKWINNINSHYQRNSTNSVTELRKSILSLAFGLFIANI